VLLVQREVAARMAAAPGADDYGALSVNVQAIAEVELLFRIPAGAFTPPPRVESAVVRVTPRADPIVRPGEEEPFRTFVQAAFALRRKQMRRVVRTVAERSAEDAERALAASGIDPGARPETLSAAQFHALGRALGMWS
jgi:16S rRNA (adenine1518-N6/adenine1519-N6)-dimethyltransferase